METSGWWDCSHVGTYEIDLGEIFVTNVHVLRMCIDRDCDWLRNEEVAVELSAPSEVISAVAGPCSPFTLWLLYATCKTPLTRDQLIARSVKNTHSPLRIETLDE
jgi:hypothetical protein